MHIHNSLVLAICMCINIFIQEDELLFSFRVRGFHFALAFKLWKFYLCSILSYVTYTYGKQTEKAKLHLSATIFSTRKALNIHAEKNVNFDEATKFFISVA